MRFGEHPDQLVDVRLPRGAPCDGVPVVVVHGGFWRAAYDRGHTGPLAADLAARGCLVAQLEYRRTGQPAGGWPATFTDVTAGLRALAQVPEFAGAYAAGRAPVLLGHSAGGHLALWVAGLPASERPPVGTVVALAPVADLYEAFARDLDDGAVVALLQGTPAQVPERYAYAQPARCPAVPVTVVHGDRDVQVPVAVSRRWVDAAQAAGCSVDFQELPGVEHFALIDPMSTAWRTVTGAVLARG